jgi:hypothetical protein
VLTKTEETPAYSQQITIKGNEPYRDWAHGHLTVQYQQGCRGGTHQFAFLSPMSMPFLRKDDVLEIKVVRKRTTMTWLGRLWTKLTIPTNGRGPGA